MCVGICKTDIEYVVIRQYVCCGRELQCKVDFGVATKTIDRILSIACDELIIMIISLSCS